MKRSTYVILFKTGKFNKINAFSIHEAKILATANQIEQGNAIEIDTISIYNNNAYSTIENIPTII